MTKTLTVFLTSAALLPQLIENMRCLVANQKMKKGLCLLRFENVQREWTKLGDPFDASDSLAAKTSGSFRRRRPAMDSSCICNESQKLSCDTPNMQADQ